MILTREQIDAMRAKTRGSVYIGCPEDEWRDLIATARAYHDLRDMWCPDHDRERLDRISAQFDAILATIDGGAS